MFSLLWSEHCAYKHSKKLLRTLPTEGPAVVLGPGGVAEGIASGAVVLDCSTIAPDTARRVARELASHGAGAVDAPVSGGSEGARKGQLTAFVGGEVDTGFIERVMSSGKLDLTSRPIRLHE